MRRIERVAATPKALKVTWADGTSSVYPLLWLRDHCPCDFHPETRQRQIDTFALPPDLRAGEARVMADGGVEVIWAPDNHISRFPAGFLADFASPAQAPAAPDRLLWDRAALGEELPAVAYESVMDQDDTGLRAWLEAVERFGFCFVRGVPVSLAATRALAERIAYIRETIFGGFWDFTADLAHADTAYTTLAVGLHTDGTYCEDAPGLQLFHCLGFEGSGGESLLADGFHAAEALRHSDPAAFATLTRVQVPARYIEPGVHLQASHPVIRVDGRGQPLQVSFNNHDRAPFLLPAEETEAFYHALAAFHALIEAPSAKLRFRLVPGEVLLFDNWRALHGREAYEGHRRLCGGYINHEDFESRLRVLREGAGNAA